MCVTIGFHSSFLGSPQEKIVTYEPTKDFSFLKRFYCISDLFGKDQWENNKGRSFNEEGVHLTNLKKHPVNACHYALFCYDEYYTSKDETFKIAFLAQVKYLLDSNSYHVVDKGMIAYPYDIKFHDLNPPWYSALAQSEAISVLIRYYAMTRDKAALDVIVQLRNFMVSPQEGVCGTKSITPEGHMV
ncbi:MAG: hypothetical protein IPP71_12145 [Bacteroidetes bacterium]|nr:hypothetical protein [Bacteroidota bacterium]